MPILLIIAFGISVVLCGILWLRLPAFLALLIAALVVAGLTPSENIQRSLLETQHLTVLSPVDEGTTLLVRVGPKRSAIVGQTVIARGRNSLEQIARYRVEELSRVQEGSRSFLQAKLVRIDDGNASVPVDDLLLIVDDADRMASKVSTQTIGSRVATGFGSTCAKIGILIAMASIIGKCLLDSGAADRIVRSALRLVGERGAPAAFVGSGFLLGIPVFFDTVFYLMIPLGKAMRMRTGRHYLLYVLTIVAGATMAHSLIPPTPGPLLVAEQLGVDVGRMMLVGSAVGLVAVLYGIAHALFVNRIAELPLRESPDLSLESLDDITRRDDSQLPPLWLAVLPILLPVILIGGATIAGETEAVGPVASRVLQTLGDKNIALVISAAIAVAMLLKQGGVAREQLHEALQSALASAGMIILITAGGGAFGTVLQQTGVAGLVSEIPSVSPAVLLTFAFLITTAIRTAQGSATVAMITAVGIVGGLAESDLLTFDPVYLACAIGCGSKPVAWMNDSGFWVITRLSGMTEAEGLRFITPMTALMGIAGLLATIVGVYTIPTF